MSVALIARFFDFITLTYARNIEKYMYNIFRSVGGNIPRYLLHAYSSPRFNPPSRWEIRVAIGERIPSSDQSEALSVIVCSRRTFPIPPPSRYHMYVHTHRIFSRLSRSTDGRGRELWLYAFSYKKKRYSPARKTADWSLLFKHR